MHLSWHIHFVHVALQSVKCFRRNSCVCVFLISSYVDYVPNFKLSIGTKITFLVNIIMLANLKSIKLYGF